MTRPTQYDVEQMAKTSPRIKEALMTYLKLETKAWAKYQGILKKEQQKPESSRHDITELRMEHYERPRQEAWANLMKEVKK